MEFNNAHCSLIVKSYYMLSVCGYNSAFQTSSNNVSTTFPLGKHQYQKVEFEDIRCGYITFDNDTQHCLELQFLVSVHILHCICGLPIPFLLHVLMKLIVCPLNVNMIMLDSNSCEVSHVNLFVVFFIATDSNCVRHTHTHPFLCI